MKIIKTHISSFPAVVVPACLYKQRLVLFVHGVTEGPYEGCQRMSAPSSGADKEFQTENRVGC